MSNIKDQVAIVTGGARGIGRAIVLKLAQMGCHVAFCFHSSREEAKTLEKQVRDMGVHCSARQVDVRDMASVKQWVNDVKQEWGRLDILINNAGIVSDKTLMMMTEKDWTDVLDINLNGMYHASKAVIVTFLKQKSGAIINISSVSGITGLPGQTNYSAAKGGINAFTKALAKEVASFGVRVNAIAPGFIETDMLKSFSEEQRQRVTDEIPLGYAGSGDDVANGVGFLLSEGAQYITGQIIQIDGGLVLR